MADESYSRSVVIDVSAADQVLTGSASGLPCDAVYIGGAGVLVVRLRNDSADATFTGLLAGNIYKISATKIVKTNTTVTNAKALWK